MSLPITIAVTEKVTGSEGLWAEHGLTGLVIFALFGLLITIIGLFVRTLVKKDEAHTKFIETMLKEERRMTPAPPTKPGDAIPGQA